MKKYFFVYGSLKAGNWNNCLFGDSKLVGKAVTKAKFLLTDVGFPYMVPEGPHTEATGHPTAPVAGDVYEVCSPAVEDALDALEGVEYGHYKRAEIEAIDLSTGHIILTQTYIPCEEQDAAQYRVCNMNEQQAYEWV